MTGREEFRDRYWLDRWVGTGIALHEGQLFGWFNQLLGLVTVLGLMTLSVTGVVLWWSRRAVGVLGAPAAASNRDAAPLFWIAVLALAIYLPLFGASLLCIMALERIILRRIPATQVWLGLSS